MTVHAAIRTEKPWGHELLWAFTDRYAGKILHVRSGERLSRQYHNDKDESQYVLTGRVILEIGEGRHVRCVELTAGEGYHVPAGLVHRLIALTDSEILEVSTPELNDIVRIADDYGRVSTDSSVTPTL